jgi:hypothetical protein
MLRAMRRLSNWPAFLVATSLGLASIGVTFVTTGFLVFGVVCFLASAWFGWRAWQDWHPGPDVALVRYVHDAGKSRPEGIGHGFALMNDGEATAYGVSIPPFTFGRFTVGVDETLQRLSREQGEQVIAPIWVERDGHNSTDLEAAWRAWEDAVPAAGLSVACVVQWHDGERKWQRPYRLRRTVTKERIKIEPAGRATRQ